MICAPISKIIAAVEATVNTHAAAKNVGIFIIALIKINLLQVSFQNILFQTYHCNSLP